MKPLDEKVALVTGGSRGIGRAVVERLARDGAAVIFSYRRDEAAATEVVKAVAAAGGTVWAVRADQAEAEEVVRLYDVAQEKAGALDIVANNAALGTVGLITDTTHAEFDRVMAVNLKGTFVSVREAARRLRPGGRADHQRLDREHRPAWPRHRAVRRQQRSRRPTHGRGRP